jgi:gluconate kinase
MHRGRWDRALCRPVRKSYRTKLICEQHAAVFLYNPVDDDHDRLAQGYHRRGRHYSRPRFMQPETQKEDLSTRQGREEGTQNENTYFYE